MSQSDPGDVSEVEDIDLEQLNKPELIQLLREKGLNADRAPHDELRKRLLDANIGHLGSIREAADKATRDPEIDLEPLTKPQLLKLLKKHSLNMDRAPREELMERLIAAGIGHLGSQVDTAA